MGDKVKTKTIMQTMTARSIKRHMKKVLWMISSIKTIRSWLIGKQFKLKKYLGDALHKENENDLSIKGYRCSDNDVSANAKDT